MAPDATLDDKYTAETGRIFVSGIQALVRLPLMQRRRDLARGLDTAGFVSGYRGSPLAGIDREFMRAKAHLDAHHVVFRPGLNEDLAATAVWGSQQLGLFPGGRYDGVFSMWYGKGPGVDRTMDVIRHAHGAGTARHGGTLLLVGDDHGAASSTIPHQSEHNLISAMVPMLSPGGLGEYLDYGLLGWAMSRFSGAWVGFKCQTEIVECSASIDLDPDRLEIREPEIALPADGLSIRWPDGAAAIERRLVDHKLRAVHAFARANRIDRQAGCGPGARIGIVASGKAWLDLLAALASLGIDEARAEALGLRLYKVGLVWPLEPEGLRAFADGLEQILVVEEKRPVIEDQIKTILYDLPDGRRPRVAGKTDEAGRTLLPIPGEIDPMMVADALVGRVGFADPVVAERYEALQAIARERPQEAAAMVREPFFCSGCPHSTSTRLPEGSRASTGIGCHMMVIGSDKSTATFTQMGGEGASWIGMSPFTDERHLFVNMGDGTYFHSGALAIRAGIAAGVNATYKILFNDAVAMTGGQPHDGALTVPAIVRQMLAEGARRVAVVAEQPERLKGALPRGVALHPRDRLDAVQRELRDLPGVSVIVYDQVCAAEKRRRRKRGAYPKIETRAFINDLVCEGCGDCSTASNCISVEPHETEFGRKRRINQSSCNGDLSCVKGFCPSFVTVTGATLKRPAPVAQDALAAADLPLPAIAPVRDVYNVLITGIGGTGVITISAVLGMAAHLEGLGVSTMDQTGLAQKNGAVFSHLRFAPTPDALNAPRIGLGEADLLLGCDMVVSASAGALSSVGRGRTRAVVDDHLAPTAAFVRDGAIDFGREATAQLIARATGDGRTGFVPATVQATALMGDAIAANMFLLGHAWQKGLVPVGLASLTRAIELNGTAVVMNLDAFKWGRLSAVDPERVAAAARPAGAAGAGPETLGDLVARRAAFLTDYQDAAYAERYRALVATAEQAEASRSAGLTGLADAVARNLFKLMATKDEYEVARLHVDRAFADKLAHQFEGDYRIRFHLAPPLLARRDPRTGRPRKMSFGPWVLPVFRVLARMKRLRGGPFDLFGRTAERRMERRLIADYAALIADLATRLTPADHATAVALARIPEQIRGFGPVKAEAAARAEVRRAELMRRLDGDATSLAA